MVVCFYYERAGFIVCNLKHGLSFQSNFPGISELNRKVDMGVRIHFYFCAVSQYYCVFRAFGYYDFIL